MATRITSISRLILVRHGQSTYNLENRFTGWKDVDLTELGVKEAHQAGKLLKDVDIDKAYTSNLLRAQKTLSIILDYNKLNIKVIKDESLNERDYGDLIGQNKKEAAIKFGSEQVQIWRRSFNIPPPNGESLEMTYNRTIPYFKKIIEKDIYNKKSIILSAHGNSIRAIIKYLFNYSEDEILATEIGWCEPWIITFNNGLITKFSILQRDGVKSMSNYPRYPLKKEKSL